MYDNNPLTIVKNHNDPRIGTYSNPDPYAIFHEGTYYVYSTGGHGVNVLQSKDLTNFEHMGHALSHEKQKNYWAPCVLFHEGIFYMYYSACAQGEADGNQEFMKVAVSNNPLGPFEYKKTLYNEFSIDPHVVIKNGEWWLFYATNRTVDGKTGTMVTLDKLVDPFTPANTPRVVVAPNIDQEIYARSRFNPGEDWYTIEGGFYFEHEGTAFLMYSANAYTHGDYFVGYAVCDASEPLETAMFSKYPCNSTYQPLIGKDEWFTGCGHNSMIRGLNGELLIVYHGRPRAEDNDPKPGDDRRLCISEVKINGNELTLARRK